MLILKVKRSYYHLMKKLILHKKDWPARGLNAIFEKKDWPAKGLNAIPEKFSAFFVKFWQRSSFWQRRQS